ncbi:TetR/AcrR family transcriptional regulator [Methylobacterium sp. E-005]|uniref:TetR/AcrR family transcriptional regulator n=1 Tax=Methylobacterium sp. E-005 TaxID=2836549 RepID=UPI001FBBBF81|nr:TetR/AcrR family transcriptional regulator [Methylobacterium sp. E-005]MCJ2088138.1 TetR/AcrR family transcriptional regulator [Methylobacterium sp. E-005]
MNAGTTTVVEVTDAQAARRERILDAAEACFVRNGFHRTTMSDLAREAAMSQGNFYRYFASKEDIVLAMAERDRARGAALVAEMEREGDRRASLNGILERFFTGITREAAVLRLDLWAETTRNSAIAELVDRSEAEAREWLCGMFMALATSPACEPAFMFEAVNPLMKGIVVGRAILPGYDPAPAVAHLQVLIEAGLNGALPRSTVTIPGTGR